MQITLSEDLAVELGGADAVETTLPGLGADVVTHGHAV
jgi:hypothetical protein